MIDFRQNWLAFAERLHARGDTARPGVCVQLAKLLGDGWPAFAAKYGLETGHHPLSPQIPTVHPTHHPIHRHNPRPAGGPGTELKALLAELGLSMKRGCGCADKARVMDRQGIAWSKANREMIVGWLRAGAGESAWADKVTAATHAAYAKVMGAAPWLSLTAPFESLIDEAIRRAEAKQLPPENP